MKTFLRWLLRTDALVRALQDQIAAQTGLIQALENNVAALEGKAAALETLVSEQEKTLAYYRRAKPDTPRDFYRTTGHYNAFGDTAALGHPIGDGKLP